MVISVESRWHTLPDGTRLEVLCAEAAAPPSASGAAPAPSRPPLLLLHGAWHGAWCWAEHFLPFFAAAGYDSYALSLRGHGGSELEEQHPAARQTGTLQSHLDDIASFVATLSRPPVLLGHSLGGLFAVAYAGQAAGGGRPPLAGLALLGAVPPSGTGSIIRRLLWRQPLQVLRIGWTFARESFRTSAAACRFVFFSKAMPEEEVEKYQAKLAASSSLPLLPKSAAAQLRWPAPPAGGWAAAGLPPQAVFVGCGEEDAIVDRAAAEEAAAFFGAQATVWQSDVGHDMMLDVGWRQVAESLLAWLGGLPAAAAGQDAPPAAAAVQPAAA